MFCESLGEFRSKCLKVRQAVVAGRVGKSVPTLSPIECGKRVKGNEVSRWARGYQLSTAAFSALNQGGLVHLKECQGGEYGSFWDLDLALPGGKNNAGAAISEDGAGGSDVERIPPVCAEAQSAPSGVVGGRSETKPDQRYRNGRRGAVASELAGVDARVPA